MKKTLSNLTAADVIENVKDIKIVGNGDSFALLAKAFSKVEDWMKTTKAYEVSDIGCIVQVTTQQGDNVAEALCFVPGVKIKKDINDGKKLVKI